MRCSLPSHDVPDFSATLFLSVSGWWAFLKGGCRLLTHMASSRDRVSAHLRTCSIGAACQDSIRPGHWRSGSIRAASVGLETPNGLFEPQLGLHSSTRSNADLIAQRGSAWQQRTQLNVKLALGATSSNLEASSFTRNCLDDLKDSVDPGQISADKTNRFRTSQFTW